MLRRTGLLVAALLGLGTTLGPGANAAPKPVPPAPDSYVLDQPGALSPEARAALSSLSRAHEGATGEQLVVAIFDSLDDEDLVDFTARVFHDWKIGQKGKDNGALLALYWKDHKARIEVGYGLEPLLTDAKSKDILEDILIPGLRQGQTDQAVLASAREMLRVLDSPVVQNAPENWRPDARFARPRHSRGGSPGTFLLILGLMLLAVVLRTLLAAEAHYTSQGWGRSTPWGAARRRRTWGGGGFGGWGGGFGGGDGGGFSGGGGRSGGGGASGSW